MLTASQGDIDASENYRLAETALLEAKAMADRNGARFILVYIPSKPHVYLPLASEQQIEQLLAAIGWVHLNNGRLTIVAEGEELPATEVLERIDDQARILERLAAASNIEFLNLTPIFQEEARQGQELYLSLGTHWNEQGHQLTARTVAEYLASNNE
jgi:lysophospholipase L1-like esterase